MDTYMKERKRKEEREGRKGGRSREPSLRDRSTGRSLYYDPDPEDFENTKDKGQKDWKNQSL